MFRPVPASLYWLAFRLTPMTLDPIYVNAVWWRSLIAAALSAALGTRGTNQESSKGKAVIMGVRNLGAGTKGRTRLGRELEQSATEILAHVKGEARLPKRRIVLPDEIDVKRIRTKARMSQAEFARAFCINPRTLQEWEQGRKKADATTRAYLAVIAKNREAVLDALAS